MLQIQPRQYTSDMSKPSALAASFTSAQKNELFGITHFTCTMGRGDCYCPLPPPFLRWNIVASPGPHQLTCQDSLITKYFHMTLKTDVATVLGRNELTGKSLVPYPGKYRVRKPCPHNQLGSYSPTLCMQNSYMPLLFHYTSRQKLIQIH